MGTRDTANSYYQEDVGQGERLTAAKRSGNNVAISSSMGPGSGAYSSGYTGVSSSNGNNSPGASYAYKNQMMGGGNRSPTSSSLLNGRR